MRAKAAEMMCAALALIVAAGCATAKIDRAQMQRERTEAQRTEALAGMDVISAESFDTALTWRLDTDQSDPAEVELTDPRAGTTDRAMAVRF